MNRVKFAHTNIIAENWRTLANFYIKVFNCKLLPPERDLSGKWLDDLTGIDNASVNGIHLLLPGYDSDGPTLEIFQYSNNEINVRKTINKEGIGHIAFIVDDVERYLNLLIKYGGSIVGKTVKTEIKDVGKINLVYAKDPEGNIVEIQKWN